MTGPLKSALLLTGSMLLCGALRAEEVPIPGVKDPTVVTPDLGGPPKELPLDFEIPDDLPPVKDDKKPAAVVVTEPAAELVSLPAAAPPLAATNEGAPVARSIDDFQSVFLAFETQAIKPGEPLTFGLYGPEGFLRGATAEYLLKDELGRELARGVVRVADLPFQEGTPRHLQIGLPPAVLLAAPKNVGGASGTRHFLEMTFTGTDERKKQAAVKFSVPRRADAWDGWLSMTAMPPATGEWDALRALGIVGSVQYRMHPARREALRKGNAVFYVENVARQLLSRYHTERGLWDRTIASMAAERGNTLLLRRDPSLCSPAFAEAFALEIKKHAEIYAKDPPLFYSLSSEPSLTNVAAAADFDFTPETIQEFQRWLERDAYGTLKALNDGWGTSFPSWKAVTPMTTDEVRLRIRDGLMNFSPWVDFREFQDHNFSKVLRDGADLLRQQQPDAKVGITGAAGPFAHGGWDWARLAKALDVVECYDIGNARAMWRDLAPGKPALAAVVLPANVEVEAAVRDVARTLWPFVLEGGPRGVLFWPGASGAPTNPVPVKTEPNAAALNNPGTLQFPDGQATPLAMALGPLLRTLDGPAGTLLRQAKRSHDGVAILYSPASVRVTWLLEADRLHGDGWLKAWGADTGAERRESPQLRLRESWGKLLDDMGLGWRFISSEEVEGREWLKPESGIRTLVLPRAVALGDREVEAIRLFVQNGGHVVADACCGRFDGHGRLRAKPALDDIFGVDTSSEPYFPEAMHALERIRRVTAAGPGTAMATDEMFAELPIFSAEPKWLARAMPAADGLEYRRSPVLAPARHGTFLNLDLTDYLRWRLHPGQPRARAVRELIAAAAFKDRLDASLIDWKRTRLPHGTQLTWLTVGSQAGMARVLALRRNPQARLHELGTEADGNWAFEKTEPFTLTLRSPKWIHEPLAVNGNSQREAVTIEGTLDPIAPSLFVVNAAPAAPLEVSAATGAVPGGAVEVKLASREGWATPSLYHIRVTGPDGVERAWCGRTAYSKDGTLNHSVPFALNEPVGAWRVNIQDWVGGGEKTLTIDVRGALDVEKKPKE